ncbi:fibronectin type III domain-containing protein [uncultured Marinobacter sp.]|uniref:fibronectin type III domain-containing protein n=1 Tax=uncultured Marinobacter sp. TaxID=187379 RepID=UPI0030D6FF26|tara:strand:- start:160 stop:591 length:432 start_codon:yes stop_codon:yes gene_type:complete
MSVRAIKASKAGIAAVICAVALAGCGGESGNAGVPVNGSQLENTGGQSGETSTTGSATLTWVAPSYRVDGTTQLGDSDISGYIVSYGRSVGELDQSADVGFCVSCQFEVDSLSEGTWYFAVQTVDSSGLVSARSDVVSKSIGS